MCPYWLGEAESPRGVLGAWGRQKGEIARFEMWVYAKWESRDLPTFMISGWNLSFERVLLRNGLPRSGIEDKMDLTIITLRGGVD